MSSGDHGKLKLLGLRESTRADTPGNKSFLSMGDSNYLLHPYKSVEKSSPESCIYPITLGFRFVETVDPVIVSKDKCCCSVT